MQMSMFDGTQDFRNDKPIRLIELFAGYGSQALALKYLGVPFEHYRISEWAVKSIQAYKDMHFSNGHTDYSAGFTEREIYEKLFAYGISSDYNEPMTLKQIVKLKEKRARNIYNNMQSTHNLGSITQIKAEDLAIVETDKYCYIMTYSFPCQDLSLAGQGKGMSKGSSTRSGLLWEVERLLEEMTERPQILLMENVPQVVGSTGIKDFAQWIERLEEFGYKNYWQLMNAKDYGIPQNRNRCFMISILGNYYYLFPKKHGFKYRLKDFLDKKIDEKYYLSDKLKFDPSDWCGNTKLKIAEPIIYDDYNGRIRADQDCIGTLTTNCGNDAPGNGVKIIEPTPTATEEKPSYRIRTLKPGECFRLMAVRQDDYERVAENQSTSSLYHFAGDSIVTACLMAIFGSLLGVDYQVKINELVDDLRQKNL